MTEDKLRKRIEELEGLAKRLVGAGLSVLNDDSTTSKNVLSLTIHDAASLLEQKETPVQEAGDVERVANAISKKLDYLSFGSDIDRDGLMRTIAQTALSAMHPSDTPPQAHGDVERVKAIIKETIEYDGLFEDSCERAAVSVLSAMRPVSVDRERLKEIRERHEGDSKTMTYESDFGSALVQARADRAFLLSALEGVNHED